MQDGRELHSPLCNVDLPDSTSFLCIRDGAARGNQEMVKELKRSNWNSVNVRLCVCVSVCLFLGLYRGWSWLLRSFDRVLRNSEPIFLSRRMSFAGDRKGARCSGLSLWAFRRGKVTFNCMIGAVGTYRFLLVTLVRVNTASSGIDSALAETKKRKKCIQHDCK